MFSLTSRPTATAAIMLLALTLTACSDSSEDSAKSPEPAETIAPAKPAAAPTENAAAPATSEAAPTESAAAPEQSEEAQTETSSAPVETAAPAETAAAPVETEAVAENPAAQPAESAAASEPETKVAAVAVTAPEPTGEVDVAKLMEPGPLKEMAIGDENAPVTIVEYMSMTCPHCAAFHENNYQPLVDKYVDTGKVRFIVREFPFDPRAAAAIMLARCAPESQFLPMVDVLFKQQQNWATAPDGREALLQIARLAGFTQESFEACLTNQKLLDDVNAVRTKGANEFGVQSTPTFFINGKRYPGNMSIEILSAIIDPLL